MAKGKTTVHIVGTGTIGEPLIGLFLDFKAKLGIDEVSFHKRTPLYTDRSKVVDLVRRGARLSTDPDRVQAFQDLGIEPSCLHEDALREADVVIDCTPVGNSHKPTYEGYLDNTKGFIAQGSETGFGKPYARGINDAALIPGEDRFIQVVSCNTHNISLMLHTIGYLNGTDYENLDEAHFVCMRRANDISQVDSYIPSPSVGKHGDERFGTHHARDAHRLFATMGVEPNCFSSAVKLNTQYMHAIWFNIRTKALVSKERLIGIFNENARSAITYKRAMNEVFAFGRDHGHYGRILNQSVVAHETLFVHGDGRQVSGFCFTPQDGNSLLSSVAATMWMLDPSTYEERIQCLKDYLFTEV